jgi:hypothetical protein
MYMTSTCSHAEQAVASKDLSTFTAEDLHMTHCRVGFTGFQKKPEFGPAKIFVRGFSWEHVDVMYIIEEGSESLVDGQAPAILHQNVTDILYGNVYGKASKRPSSTEQSQ